MHFKNPHKIVPSSKIHVSLNKDKESRLLQSNCTTTYPCLALYQTYSLQRFFFCSVCFVQFRFSLLLAPNTCAYFFLSQCSGLLFTYAVFSLSNLVDLELFDAGALAHLSPHLVLDHFLRRLWLGLHNDKHSHQHSHHIFSL